MKSTYFALTLLFLGIGRQPLAAQETSDPVAEPLTLEQAVATALERNPWVRAGKAELEQAEAGLAEAKAGRLPRLSFEETYTNSNNPVFVFGTLLEQGRFGVQHFDPGFLNAPGSIDNFRSTLNVQIPVFNRFKVSSGIRRAKLQREQAGAQVEWIEQQLRARVVEAYFGVLVADFRRRVAEEAVKSAEADLENVRAKVESGVAVFSDLLAMEVQVADFRRQLVEAEGDLRTAQAALNTLLDRPVEAPVQLAGSLEDRDFAIPSLPDLLAQALRHRPDYRNAERQVEQAEAQLRAARGEYWPDLNLFASAGRSSYNLTDGSGDFAVGARLSWNLVDFGREPRIRQNLAAVEAARAQRDQLEQQIRVELVQALEAVRSARQQVVLARTAVDRAAEALRIVQDRYQVGLTTITEVLRAQTAHLQARFQLLGARYRHYVSFARLQLATGNLQDVSWFKD
ncbi:MAG: TolC family protein [Acidobacteriota bacterium]